MKITIEISDKRITDLIHGHGGSYSPWLHELVGEWNGPRGCRVKFDREKDEEGESKGRMRIGRRAIARGMTIFAKLPSFGDFIEENDDDITFDTFLQCVIFGKLVYG